MIIYFADRRMNILGVASDVLPGVFHIRDDMTTKEVETGVMTFEVTVDYKKDTHLKAKEYCKAGNFLLVKNKDGTYTPFTIIDKEDDISDSHIYIYAEDAGLDLLNEIVPAYEAASAASIADYILVFTADSGFEIGTNELGNSVTKLLSFDNESTATERIRDVAIEFDNAELDYSFAIDKFKITHKYINIYKKRGKDVALELRFGREINSIVEKESVANLVTALRCVGGTPEATDSNPDPLPITLVGYSYDDGDIYTDSVFLKSRTYNQKWTRYLTETGSGEGYLVGYFSYDTTSQQELCTKAIEELKKLREPEISYDVSLSYLPENLKIGDTCRIIDDNGELYVSARLIELKISECNNTREATFGDFKALTSGINEKVQKLADEFAKFQAARTLYTWIVFADDNQGTNMSTSSTGKDYIGIATNKISETPDLTNPSYYTFSRINALDGRGFTVRGTWASGVSYSITSTNIDVVEYEGSTYACNTSHVSGSTFDQSKWTLIAEKGTGGEDGERGVGILRVTTAPTSKTGTTSTGFSYKYRILTQTVIDESGMTKVLVGDTLEYDEWHYPVGTVGEYVYLGERISLKGPQGISGQDGEDGYNQATIYVYKRSSSSVSTKPGAATYTFSTGSLSFTSTSDWSRSIPVTDGNPCYVSYISLSSKDNSVNISQNDWQSPIKLVEDGSSVVVKSATKTGDKTTIILTDLDGDHTIEIVDGEDGSDGQPGVSGYVHIAWATSADGSEGFSTSVSEGKTYLGTYTDENSSDSEDPTDYNWSLIKGADGEDGEDGHTPVISGSKSGNTTTITSDGVAIATILDGTDGVDGHSPTITTSKSGDTTTILADGVSIGTVTDGDDGHSPSVTATKSNGVTTVKVDGTTIATINDGSSVIIQSATKVGDTTTVVLKDGSGTQTLTIKDGEDGDNGQPGSNGDDAYVHIAWATAADGSTGFSTSVSEGKTYMGSYSDHTQADSTTPSDYNWSLIKGADGDDGEDAYTVILTNDNHTFAAGTSAAIATSTTCSIIAYKGDTQVSCYAGSSSSATSISTGTTGITCSISNNNSTNVSLTISVTTSLTTKNGTFTIPVVVDGHTFNKVFTFSLAIQGVSVTNITSTNNTEDGGTSTVTVTLSDGTTKTFTVKNGETGSTAEWYYGADLTHVSGTATLPISSTNGVVVGAMYLNPNTSLVYKCTAISGSNATWTYAGDITTGVLENLEIGGRNLSTGTGTSKTFTKTAGKTWFNNGGFYPVSDFGISLIRKSTADDVYCLSFDWTATNVALACTIGAFLRSSSTGYSASASNLFDVTGNSLTVTGSEESCSGHFYGKYKLTNQTLRETYGDKWLLTTDVSNSQNDNLQVVVSNFMFEKATIGSTWSLAPEDVESTITAVQTLAQAAKDSADGKVTTFYQSGTPTANAIGDLWIDTTDSKNSLKRWDGTSWVVVDNADLQTALTNAATAQATADGKIVTFAQASSPTATDVGDIWIDTDDNNRLYRWNGSAWVDVAADVDVGGTNLWISNAGTFGYLAANGTLTLSSSVHHIASTMRRYIPVSPGEKFVYQHWNPTLIDDATNYGQVAFYNSEKTHIRYSDGTTNTGNYECPKVRSADGEHVIRYFTAPPNAAYMRICTCYANDLYDFRVKIERGNVPTAYSPSPEDMSAEAAGISSPNLALNTKQPSTDDIVKSNDNLIAVSDDGIITLQPTSSACYAKWKSYLNGGIKYQECNNKTYSVSFEAKRGESSTYTAEKQLLVYLGINAASRYESNYLNSTYDRYRAQYTNVWGDWKRYHCSFVIPSTFSTGTTNALVDDNYMVIQFGAESAQVPILIRNIKLELGDIATEYAPSEQDTDNAINAATSSAQTANDNATAAINASKENSEAITGLDEIINGTENTTGLVDLVNNLESTKATAQSVDDLRAEKNADINKIIEDYNLSDFQSWFHFDSNQGLIIGKSGTSSGNTANYVLRLEGDIISFYENTSGIDNLNDEQRVGYFQNRNLMSENIVALSTLDLGNFRFIKQSNGNLSFVYTG